MNRKHTFKTRSVLVLVIPVIAILVGCAAKRPFWGDPETGLILQYLMPENQVLKYQTSMESTQNMEIGGQQVESKSNQTSVFSVTSKGQKGDNHQLEITIESMSINVTNPQRELSPDMSSVIGKSFDMTLSFLGKELDLSGAEAIQYEMDPGNKRSIAPGFQTIFPDLAGRPVRIGDSWTTTDTMTEKIGNAAYINSNFDSLNTLEGFETVNGLECVKITAAVTGTLEGEGKEGNADLSFEGKIEGSATWHFAYKKGLFVKYIFQGFAKVSATVTGPQNMTIPITQKSKIETKLIK